MNTRDEVLAMAEQVGAVSYSPPPMRAVRGVSFEFDQLERFAALAFEAGRKTAEQDRVDAERYRWILDRISGDRYPSGVARFRLPDISAHEGIFKGSVAQHFNDAIDRARSAK